MTVDMKMKWLVSIVAIVAVLLTFGAIPAGADQGALNEVGQPEKVKTKWAPDEILVKFKADAKHFRVIKVPEGKVLEKVKEYSERTDVDYAEPNYYAYAFWSPNDPYYSYQWDLDNPVYGGIQMEQAWGIQTGSASVVVAVVDTGVAYENYSKLRKRYYLAPDLANTVFVPGYDFVENDTHPNDDNSHGTHVTGTIAQSTDNGLGVAGIAFNTAIMPVKVLDRYGSGTYADVADGIVWATDHGADIISLSLGGSSPSSTLEGAVKYAYDHGVTVIAAAGNDGSSRLSYPAAYDDCVIAVGATRYDETLAYYSNYGTSLDLVAPGGDTRVDQNGDGHVDGILQNTFNPNTKNTGDFGYWFFQGTSMATPHVSGVAALLLAQGNAGTPDEVRTALQETAEDLGAPGRDNTYGWGLVNAYAALQWNAGPTDNPPTVSVTSPSDGTTISGQVTINATASDDVGVAQIEFSIDGTGIAIDSDGSDGWSTIWNSNSVSDGEHTITAEVTDTIGQKISDSVGVTVDNVNDSPVADAGPDRTVSDADGTGEEVVTLDGSGSYDPDGTISSYNWTEGATVLGVNRTFSHNFAVGTHNVTLTVTDDKGASASDDCIVDVVANQAPVAYAGPDQSAYVGDTVNFDGSGSSDTDGGIVSYGWSFGDGTSGSGAAATHAYSLAGTYTVTLTVTDNGAATDSDTASVTITEKPAAPTAYVSIDLSTRTVRSRWRVTATVTITEDNASGPVIAGATVYGTWSGDYSRGVSATTGSSGTVSFRTGYIRGSGTVTFAVTRIVKNGVEYVLAGDTDDSVSGSSRVNFR